MTTKKKRKHKIIIKSYRNKRLEEVPILYDAIEFFLDELLKRCTIEYKINLLVTLRNGIVIADDGSHNVGIASEKTIKGKNWYTIDVSNDVPFLELLSTIAHETVHVIQYATGRLKNEYDWIWDGANYGPNPYTGKSIDNKLPWEYDAYTKETELSRKFVKFYYLNQEE